MPLRTACFLLALALPAAVPLRGQIVDIVPAFPADSAATQAPQRQRVILPLPVVGSPSEEAARLAQLRGEAPSEGFLLRAPSSLLPRAAGDEPRLWLVAPEVQVGWNSDIPFGLNDGAMWSGRGANTLVRAGFVAQAGPVRLIVAPELTYAANAAFDSLIPPAWVLADSQMFLPPWQVGEHSVDLPYRMGDASVREVHAGQSSLTVTAGAVDFGAATENEWWGPGTRNALLLSNQAPGFGHLFVRTARPLRTPLGGVEARWISGALRTSEWYARERGVERGWRSLSGAAVVLSPSRTLTIGVARTVHAPADGAGDALSQAASVFTRWASKPDSLASDPFEQITALWGRLVVPEQGAEVYFEWARTRLPASLRDLMESPEHSQGYTLGGQWLRPAFGGNIRLQGELTYIEESTTFAWRANGSWYASAAVREGYTNEGQVLGASVGPGASGQWVAVDWLRGRGRAGAFLGRIRWAEDSYYDKPGGANRMFGHDVSVYGGARGALAIGPVRLDAEYTAQKRWNYLFQSEAVSFTSRYLTQNVMNHTLRLGISMDAPHLTRE